MKYRYNLNHSMSFEILAEEGNINHRKGQTDSFNKHHHLDKSTRIFFSNSFDSMSFGLIIREGF